MCDTMVAMPSVTKDRVVLFGKNSDREPDEAQNLEVVPAQIYATGSELKCTHISIPQAERTNRIFLCRPFWMWGAEMGANEYGVIIGNEALFTKEKPEKAGLTGMDLLRLALERGRTAKEARDVIVSLLERYGQGGKCGYKQGLPDYMNGFLIADREEAFVLETVKKFWAWKKVKDYWSISNIISLTNDFDDCHPGLIKNAIDKGWCKSESDFNFRKCYSDRLYTYFAMSKPRECASRALLERKKGTLTVKDFMDILRDHGSDPNWRPYRQNAGTICMHAGNRLTRPTQTTCSLVASLSEKNYFYSTGASNPCLSPFFPVFSPKAGLPSGYKPSARNYDETAWWWNQERIHRKAIFKFSNAQRLVRPLLDRFEIEMIASVDASLEIDQKIIDLYFKRAQDIIAQFEKELDNLGGERTGIIFSRYWRRYNIENGIPE